MNRREIFRHAKRTWRIMPTWAKWADIGILIITFLTGAAMMVCALWAAAQ